MWITLNHVMLVVVCWIRNHLVVLYEDPNELEGSLASLLAALSVLGYQLVAQGLQLPIDAVP